MSIETGFASLSTAITKATGIGPLIHHTGGGCFVLEVALGDGYLWASADQDGVLPETDDGPWWLIRYNDPWIEIEDEGTVIGENLDRAALVAAIKSQVDA